MRYRSPSPRSTTLPFAVLVLTLSTLATGACASRHALAPRPTAEVAGIAWLAPAEESDRASLDRWERVVGPPVVHVRQGAPPQERELVLVSWNAALGEGNVVALVADLLRTDAERAFVLLIQEAYRGGLATTAAASNAAFARRHGGRLPDIVAIAERFRLNLYYVPSMRNGAPAQSDQDRGNAILSTLPLEELTAIELPYERQRRVAVAATVRLRSSDGELHALRLVSAHLDNRVGARRLWFPGGLFARARQARALVEALRDEDAAVLAGDFNSWLGFGDIAVRETLEDFPDTPLTDGRPTFRNLLRLDHLFARVPDGWSISSTRGSRRYGSDHWPLVATIRAR
ncbi:MAG TPA: endonuclease/exonuclease/phosphatase family protein [Vicinamibacterales bacterium]|nr:endonuclease/exonuclease/phosphatase family protein [Vicinamibacterales bacterium]